MKKKRSTEEQIIRILQEAESGMSVADVYRKHNCSEWLDQQLAGRRGIDRVNRSLRGRSGHWRVTVDIALEMRPIMGVHGGLTYCGDVIDPIFKVVGGGEQHKPFVRPLIVVGKERLSPILGQDRYRRSGPDSSART